MNDALLVVIGIIWIVMLVPIISGLLEFLSCVALAVVLGTVEKIGEYIERTEEWRADNGNN